MKQHAVIIASILFAAGSAARADDSTKQSSTSTPPVASQYDPASGAYGSSGSNVSGSYSSEHNTTSVAPFHADSSVRGGSNEARGTARRHLESEGPARPLDPSIQADSSIRGGSREARGQRTWNQDYSSGSTYREAQRQFKADSSIRGGSNEARYPYRWTEPSSRDDFGQSSSETWLSDGAGSVRGSANWNPSDDLLPDGTLEGGQTSPEMNNDASVGGAASSSTGTGSSASPLDDMTSSTDLNASKRLEENISGDYDLDRQTDPGFQTGNTLSADIPSDGAFQNDSVGGPGSVQTGVSSSIDSEIDSTPIDTTDNASGESGIYKFRNNRAQGVGSAAAGEFGSATSSTAIDRSAAPLGQRVKSTLTRESTGTHGMMRHDVARNIQVSSQGGTVTLKGTVPSQKDKEMIEIRTREISGVQRVDNQLTVTPQADPALRDLSTGHDLEDQVDQLQDLEKQN